MNASTVEREILDFAERWAEAIVSNDAEAIEAFMADDWAIVGENGVTNKPEFLSWISSGDLTHETMQMVGEPRIKIYGDTAILNARVTNNGHYKNQPFAADEWTTDVFRKSESGWLCVLSHISPSKDYNSGASGK
jgi:ketosteroid isomerase-like protein